MNNIRRSVANGVRVIVIFGLLLTAGGFATLKAQGDGRKSEGLVVPEKMWKHIGGKRPCFSHA